MLGSGVFDEKLQGPWALLLRSFFFRERNYKTLVQSNSAHLFFDETFQFHHFSIKPSCSFLERTVWITTFFNFLQRPGYGMATRNIQHEKCEMYHKIKEYILRLQIQQSSSFLSVAP